MFKEQFGFEIAKLDDVIYLQFGFRNNEVIKAFTQFELLEGPQMTQ